MRLENEPPAPRGDVAGRDREGAAVPQAGHPRTGHREDHTGEHHYEAQHRQHREPPIIVALKATRTPAWRAEHEQPAP